MNIACLANITGVVSVKYENITQLGTIYILVGQLESYLIYILTCLWWVVQKAQTGLLNLEF